MTIECADAAMCEELARQQKELVVTMVRYSVYVVVTFACGYIGGNVFVDYIREKRGVSK